MKESTALACTMTVGELQALIESTCARVFDEYQDRTSKKGIANGVEAFANYLGWSYTKARQWINNPVNSSAVIRNGRKISVDIDRALKILSPKRK